MTSEHKRRSKKVDFVPDLDSQLKLRQSCRRTPNCAHHCSNVTAHTDDAPAGQTGQRALFHAGEHPIVSLSPVLHKTLMLLVFPLGDSLLTRLRHRSFSYWHPAFQRKTPRSSKMGEHRGYGGIVTFSAPPSRRPEATFSAPSPPLKTRNGLRRESHGRTSRRALSPFGIQPGHWWKAR